MFEIKIVLIALFLWDQLFCNLITCQQIYFLNEFELALQTNAKPEHYNVELDLRTIEEGFFNGKCSIYIRFHEKSATINLHVHLSHVQIEPSSIHVCRIYQSECYEVQGLTNILYCDKTHILVLKFDDFYFIPNEQFRLEISFKTTLYEAEEDMFESPFTKENGNEIWLLGTYLQTGIRRIFPCWDEPNYKATFNISINHLTKHIIMSNTPGRTVEWFQPRKNLYDLFLITYFNNTLPIPPSLIAIVVSHFNDIPVRRNNFRCRQQTALHLRFAEMVIENFTVHLESQWRRYKELTKVNHIAIPGFRQRSINKLDLVFYSETSLLYDAEVDSVARKIDIARLVGHAVVDQCFYNLVNPALKLHPWLYEGILTLFAANDINKIYPDFRILDLFVVQILQESLRLDTRSIMKPLMSKANNTFACYMKAPAILRMMQHNLDDEIFRKGIERFLNNRESSNIKDLWTAMQLVRNKPNIDYKYSIRKIMFPSLRLNHYLILKVTHFNFSHVIISTENILDRKMRIPITFTTQDDSNFNNTFPYIFEWRRSKDSFILESNSSGWIIFNIQQAGYYRVNYDAIYWERIVDYLNSPDDYTKIHVLNRAQIIDDAFYFLTNDQLSLSTFLNLTNYLQRETDYVAWYPMIKALEHMSGFFLFKGSEDVKIHMRGILYELLIKIRFFERSWPTDEKPNDITKCLRQEAAKWACILGDPNCYVKANYILKQHLNGTERLLPEWKKWAYCNGLRNDDNIGKKMIDTLVKKSDSKLLEYLPCSGSLTIILDYLRIIVSKSGTCGLRNCKDLRIHPKDRANSFLLTVAKHAKNDEVLYNILINLRTLKSSEVSWYATFITIINNVHSKYQLDEVLEFVKNYDREKEEISKSKLVSDSESNRQVHEALEAVLSYKNVPILLLEQKISARLSEITNQLYYFQNLVRN